MALAIADLLSLVLFGINGIGRGHYPRSSDRPGDLAKGFGIEARSPDQHPVDIGRLKKLASVGGFDATPIKDRNP